jgi:hypothetical protein
MLLIFNSLRLPAVFFSVWVMLPLYFMLFASWYERDGMGRSFDRVMRLRFSHRQTQGSRCVLDGSHNDDAMLAIEIFDERGSSGHSVPGRLE